MKKTERFLRWESYCRGCGVCCYEKKRDPLTDRFYTDFTSPCTYLDETTKRCMVYENRFRECKSCKKMTLFHALFADFLPPNCGYVERFRFWRRKR